MQLNPALSKRNQDGATVDVRELKKFLQKNLALAKRKILEDYLAAKGGA